MLYSNNVPMLTIHEKTKSEMGLRSTFFILSYLAFIEFQDFVFAEIVNQTWGDKADKTSHAHIRQEVLRQVYTRVGSKCSHYKQNHNRQIYQKPFPVVYVI